MPVFQPSLIRHRAFERHPRLSRVRAYCMQNLSEKITLATAARIAGLEYTYFSALFHNQVGVCFGDWLRYLRVNRAQVLIRAGIAPIASVSEATGFSNLRTFQRAFLRMTGLTPREFRHDARMCSASNIDNRGDNGKVKGLTSAGFPDTTDLPANASKLLKKGA